MSIFEYTKISILGEGNFGVVYLARKKVDSREVAIKCIPKENIREQVWPLLLNEKILGIKARTENASYLLKHLASFISPGFLVIVSEFDGNGTLDDYIKRGKTHNVNLLDTRLVMFEATSAVFKIHEWGYLHKDVKPDNILVTDKGHIKLADFGSSVKINTEELKLTCNGTLDYASYEMLDHKPSCQSDYFSLGIVLYKMTTGVAPAFNTPSNRNQDKFYEDFEKAVQDDALLLHTLGPLEQILFTGLTEYDLTKRFNREGIIESEYFEGVDFLNPVNHQPPCNTKLFMQLADENEKEETTEVEFDEITETDFNFAAPDDIEEKWTTTFSG